MSSIAASFRPEYRVLGIISAGHFMSHFYAQSIPPLLLYLNQDLGIPFTLLGLMLSLRSMSSGAMQLPAGILVDRYGAKTLLFIGLTICALSTAALGLATSAWVLFAAMIVWGAANSVFHPADYSLMSGTMNESRMGRSFSIHTFAGHIGGAVAPAVLLTVTAIWNWRVSLIGSALVGMVIALILATQWKAMQEEDAAGIAARQAKKEAKKAKKADQSEDGLTTGQVLRQIVTSPPMLLLLLFFSMTALAQGGLKNFAIVGLQAVHGTAEVAAGTALSAFLFASAFGVLVGGFVADNTKRHDLIAAGAMALAGGAVLVVGFVDLHFFVLVAVFTFAGMVNGIIRPSRDIMIRNASPKGSAGKAFGFVHSGQLIGGGLAPVAYGAMLDIGKAEWIFISSAVFMVLCLTVILLTGRASRRSPIAREV